MIKPANHPQENSRLNELESFSILDTLPEEDYDNLTAIAAEICGTPIALVSLLDDKRQWFKSHHGLDATETAKEFAFCAHAINDESKVFIINDATKDERFFDNPLVTGDPNVIFYAGVSLTTEKGLPLGTLCVIDNKPNDLTVSQRSSMSALGKQVMNVLNLRRNKTLLEKSLEQVKEKNLQLERFAAITAHDLKSPLVNVQGLVQILLEDFGDELNEQGLEILKMVEGSATKLKNIIDSLLAHTRCEKSVQLEKEDVILSALEKDMNNLFYEKNDPIVKINSSLTAIKGPKMALHQVLINLIGNAVKYCKNESPKVEIDVAESNALYFFKVKDNAIGIEEKDHAIIFEIFSTLGIKDKFGEKGSGIGLATVKKIIEFLGGTVSLQSQLGKGSVFTFSIQK